MITIHMTTHRRLASGLLQRAVESVLLQDLIDFEFVVCDPSVDGTAAYLHRAAVANRRVRVFHNEINVNSVAISLGRCLQQSDPTRSWISWMLDNAYCCQGHCGVWPQRLTVQKNRRSGVCCR
jgi:glycosyltransferase involved in cell wall biosynthesis